MSLFRPIRSFVQRHRTDFTFTATRPPLFQKDSPWWAKWAPALIGLDIFFTASSIDLAWNHWQVGPADTEETAEESTYKTLLRDFGQRGGICFGYLVMGSGVAGALLLMRSRYLRTFDIIPHTLPKRPDPNLTRQVFIQISPHKEQSGNIFSLDKCALRKGRDDTELILRVDGQRGHYFLSLDNARINGYPATALDARDAILGAWKGGKLEGKLEAGAVGRWKGGPVAN